MGLGVALSGGGLKCIAHIGALKALEELDIRIEYISGTSSGSIIAALFAMGYDIKEMRNIIEQYYKIFTTIDKRPIIKAAGTFILKGQAQIGGLTEGERIEELVNAVANTKGIYKTSDISIPFAVATVDTISTRECIFVSKNINLPKHKDIDYIYDAPIGIAIRASMAFPGIFTTCDYNEYNFIDGGTKDNLPVRILKDMGASKTLALAFKYDKYIPTDNVFSILLRTCDIFSQKDVEAAKKLANLAIEIDANGTSLLNIDNIEKCYNAGYTAIIENKAKILELYKNR